MNSKLSLNVRAGLLSLLILAVLWLWVDLNEELADMPTWRGLPLTVRIWRWSLSFYCLGAAALAASNKTTRVLGT